MDNRKPYAAVIFDLDGVLVDSEPIHLRAVDELLRKRNIVLTPEQAAAQTGITIYQFFKKMVDEWGLPGPLPGEDWVNEKRAMFRELAQAELGAVPGADAVLRRLYGKVKIAVATSSSRRYLDWMIDRFAWHGLFDAVCTVDDIRHPKPDPEIYQLALKRLGIEDGRSVLVFEDSPAGVEAARATGLEICGVATSFAPELLLELGARWAIPNFTDQQTLERILGDLMNGKKQSS